MQKQRQYINQYEVHQMLGDGGQAQVYLVSKDQELYAAKVYLAGTNRPEWFNKQVSCLKRLQFKHLINLVQSIPNATIKLIGQPEEKRNVIIMEYANKGEVFQMLSKQGRFTSRTCKRIFKQLIEAIQYMNSVGITHRDLKPDNLIFDRNFDLKVTDLGLSTFNDGQNQDGIFTSKVGTEGFRSPEMQQGKYRGLQSDMFAAGVILFLMFSGSPPFLSTRYSDKIYRIIRDGNFQKFWSLHEKKKGQGFYPIQFKKLLNSFFSVNPDRRPTFETLKNDPWLNEDVDKQIPFLQQMQYKLDCVIEQDENKQQILRIEWIIMNGLKGEQYQNDTCQSSKQFELNEHDDINKVNCA